VGRSSDDERSLPRLVGSFARQSQNCFAADHHGHLIEMPVRSWARAMAAKLSSKQRSELQHPASDRLVGDIQPALGEQILDITEAECESNIEPHSVPNDRRGKLVTSE
jgi:hypothetical protein